MRIDRRGPRRGAVLPLVTLCLVGLMGFLALAIDVGVLAVARNQAQNAADIAALAGARTLTGTSSNNYNVTGAVSHGWYGGHGQFDPEYKNPAGAGHHDSGWYLPLQHNRQSVPGSVRNFSKILGDWRS